VTKETMTAQHHVTGIT